MRMARKGHGICFNIKINMVTFSNHISFLRFSRCFSELSYTVVGEAKETISKKLQ
jgi:hypothetical protein